MLTKPATRTAHVIVRHSRDCKDKNKGSDYTRCNCPKSIWLYDGEKDRRVSAKTRSWGRAEKLAQEYRDSWDPAQQELKKLRAEKEAKQVPLAEAVALYCADMITRLGDNGTVLNVRALLGHVDPETKEVRKNGHLFDWLATLPAESRPQYVADITPAHLTAWRSSWGFGDYTGAQRWSMVKGFLNFCEAQGWIQESPARKLRRIEYKKGSRTAIFTDGQYAAILETARVHVPETVPEVTKRVWQQRMLAFIELLRWSGMAIIDAVQFRPQLVDSEGVLRYRRQKTHVVAVVPLPDHVVDLLRSVPLEPGSIGPDQPFRTKDNSPHSDTIAWRKRLMRLFALAGITEVRNEVGRARNPHPHMLRDSFAVWNLRHGVPLHCLSKMLGHKSPLETAKSYLPFVQELETSMIEAARKALASIR